MIQCHSFKHACWPLLLWVRVRVTVVSLHLVLVGFIAFNHVRFICIYMVKYLYQLNLKFNYTQKYYRDRDLYTEPNTHTDRLGLGIRNMYSITIYANILVIYFKSQITIH